MSENKGSVLVFTLIIASIISTVTMMCIELSYSNSNIVNLEYKETILKEKCMSSIEIIHSNVISKIEQNIDLLTTQEKFQQYFLGNEFKQQINDISYSDIDNTIVRLSTITVDSNGDIRFYVNSISSENKFKKEIKASVVIISPFKENSEIGEDNIVIPKDIVKFYDYKEV